MSGVIRPENIDPVIHERARLAIVSALAVAGEMSFNELKASLSLTDGNLSAHARTLEQAGYVAVEKSFQDRRPRTKMRLTPAGREAFRNYLVELRRIVERGEEKT